MKAEKYLLTAFCIAACVWVASMIAGLAGLSRYQDPPASVAYLEVLAFAAAATIPLATTWWRAARKPWLHACWGFSILYVCFLAARYTTHDPAGGVLRLLLWTAIVGLAVRQTRREALS